MTGHTTVEVPGEVSDGTVPMLHTGFDATASTRLAMGRRRPTTTDRILLAAVSLAGSMLFAYLLSQLVVSLR